MPQNIEPEPRYNETNDPHNPPAAVVRPQARTAALVTFLGGIILFFLLFGAGLMLWTAIGPESDQMPDPSAVGTGGDSPSDLKPGGFDPAREHGSTDDELEYRGVDEPTQGPMRGLTSDGDEDADATESR